MGKKSDPPPPPDYSGIAKASEKQSELSYKLAQEQFAWAKETYANDKVTTERVVDSFLTSMDLNNEAAATDRERYEQIFQPLEDDLAADALDYASEERRQAEIGRAKAGVAQQFDQAREAAQKDLESYGINPSSTRYAALDIGIRTQQAAAAAGAANQASQQVDNTGRALRSEAINIGRGYPGQVAGTYATGQNAGTGAIDGNLNTTQSGAATMGTAPQYMQAGNQALSTWGNTLNAGYQNQIAGYNAQQKSSSGIGSVLGMAGGIVGKAYLGLDEGGVVPEQVSPSRGAIPDDVPAKLTAGEFVMPDDAVRWHGEKAMYAMIDKARKEKAAIDMSPGAMNTNGAPSALPAR